MIVFMIINILFCSDFVTGVRDLAAYFKDDNMMSVS